ncbi:hypothetical protein MJA45_13490 [Paenibacillus aurantius]|uniref:Uncharacterized protein n=1 Tax=Paenibacillus aurantius TaxID=2918900 RepID=A0AA96LKZ1_9BACL|nr:hypothetical protein [Paenibacillus aurantius]WNQ13985.1 hypothetical protein MJA45_13490 [Paenibacillus aurantius]
MSHRWKGFTAFGLALMIVFSGCQESGNPADGADKGKFESPEQESGKSQSSDTPSKPTDSVGAAGTSNGKLTGTSPITSRPPSDNTSAASIGPTGENGAAKTNKPLRYDPFTVKEGDQLGSWTVTKVRAKPTGDYIVSFVDYSGSAEVTGHFTHFEENVDFLGGQVFFTLLPDSANRIPMVYIDGNMTDRSTISFVLENADKARQLFGGAGTRGVATIKISDYKTQYAPKEIWDTAKLVEVINKETPVIDLHYVKKYIRMGMTQNEVSDWFGNPSAFDTSGALLWRYDYGSAANGNIAQQGQSTIDGIHPDTPAIEKGILSMQLFVGWTKDHTIDYLEAYTKGSDGKVQLYRIPATK